MSSALKWREHVAVADMHCRLAAKLLNSMAQTDRPAADFLLANLGKAEECAKAAQAAVEEARAEVERLFRRQSTVKGAVVRRELPPVPLKVPLGPLGVPPTAYCEWRKVREIGSQFEGAGGEKITMYMWILGCRPQVNCNAAEPPEVCRCGKRARAYSVPVPAT